MAGLPKTLNGMLTRYAVLKREANAIKKELDGLKFNIDAAMGGLRNYEVDGAVAFYKAVDKAEVDSWSKIGDFIVANNAPEILQRRIAIAAVRERKEAGEPVPVRIVSVDQLNIKVD